MIIKKLPLNQRLQIGNRSVLTSTNKFDAIAIGIYDVRCSPIMNIAIKNTVENKYVYQFQ